MCRDELVAALVRNPFRPFVLVVTDGKRYLIRRLEMIMVTLNSVVIGKLAEDSSDLDYPLLDYFVVIDMLHVVRIEEFSEPRRDP